MGQGITELAVGVGVCFFDIFSRLLFLSSVSLS